MQALEQMVKDARAQPTIDVYTNGLAELYTGMGGSPFGPPAWEVFQSGMSSSMDSMQGYGVGHEFQTTLPQYLEPIIQVRQIMPEQIIDQGCGLLDPQPVHTSYDLPGIGAQLHLHGPDPDIITHAHIKSYGQDVLSNLNGYDASMAAYRADLLKFTKNNY